MGLIGRSIVQTRKYVDPTNPPPPQQNYEETFPITVFDAVRKDMDDEESETLSELLTALRLELQGKQPLFPAKPGNYLMTYAGVPGAIGAIQMSMDIPWDPQKQSNDKIPTEKAVGNLMFKLGLVDENGNIINPDRAKIRYSDIIGRPLMYEVLGNNSDGFITQKGITEILANIRREIDTNCDAIQTELNTTITRVTSHLANNDNPHNVTIDQIGAASASVVSSHIDDFNNPHQVDKEQVGLSKVDNTSDMDKPISHATQDALNALKDMLNVLQDDAKGFVTDIQYDRPSGVVTVTYHNKSYIKFLIPIDGLVDELRYNKETKQFDVYELSGEIKHIDVSDLFIRYVGSTSSSVKISIIGDNDTGEQIIHAVVEPLGITDLELADQAVITRVLADQSVTADKIEDVTITTEKYADGSITTEKVALHAIVNTSIADRAVNGRTLFTSMSDNRVIVVTEKGSDPHFGQINSQMIEDAGVDTINIHNDSVTADKIADAAVIASKIRDGSVETDKLHDSAVTNQKLADRSVDGSKVVDSVNLPGSPTIGIRPNINSDDSSVPDTRWVMDRIREYVNQNHNYGDRTVDGRVLFSSDVRHRVLAVLRANSDPVWTQIDGEMISPSSVNTDHIVDSAITAIKISSGSIWESHLNDQSVSERTIRDSAVTSSKIFKSDNANMVLAALSDDSHPVYSKIVNGMMAHNSISTNQIEDGCVTLSKIMSSDQPNRLMGVTLKNTNPHWLQANTQMIADGAITVDKIHAVPFRDMVLGSQSAGQHPQWTKINGNMILNDAIVGNHIADSEITGDHIKDRSIESKHILQYQIETEHIAPGAIGGYQMFTSEYPNRVLAVTDPFSKAEWLQVDTDMIRDESIIGRKMFQSKYPYRVLGSTQAGVPPEYIKITNDFIMDDTIRSQKLVRDLVLYGHPQIDHHPDPGANGYDITTTKWVRDTVAEMINDFNPEILFDTVETDMIKNRAIDGTKLFSSIYPGPRLLGVTDKGEDPEYLLVEENMIADASVTTNKLQRDIHLLGSPRVEIRPSPGATEQNGEGSLIPDCQWVLDRISEHSFGVGSGTPPTGSTISGIPVDGSVTTPKIQNRAVTADKLFTTANSNSVLAVLSANANPIYTKINSAMMSDDSVPDRAIFKSSEDNRVLTSLKAGVKPSWTKVNRQMMDINSVATEQIVDESITGDKIANNTIGREKFVGSAFIDEALLYDNSVSDRKIQDGAVRRSKIEDGAVNSDKLDSDIVLRGRPTVEYSTDYEKRSIRNIVLSPNAPVGGHPGDIWIRYN